MIGDARRGHYSGASLKTNTKQPRFACDKDLFHFSDFQVV